MRILLLFLFTQFSLQSICQVTVQNNSSEVSMDRRLVVYIGIDNPITISTGSEPNAKVFVKDGILTSAGGNGKYWLRTSPDKWSPTITVTVKTSKEEREFVFDVVSLSNPELRFAGTRNEDNMFDNFRSQAKGVYCYIRYFELPAYFRVDSFMLAIYHQKDSAAIFLHTNKGAAWDSITLEKIWTAKGESFVKVSKVWITGPDGRQFIQKPELWGYIKE